MHTRAHMCMHVCAHKLPCAWGSSQSHNKHTLRGILQGRKTVFLSNDLPPSVETHHALASAINSLFEGRMSRDLLALSVVLASPPCTMKTASTAMGMRPHALPPGAGPKRGMPGAAVGAGDEALLCVQLMHRFWVGEVIAVKVSCVVPLHIPSLLHTRMSMLMKDAPVASCNYIHIRPLRCLRQLRKHV